jgi:hypothetical protein
MLARQELYHWAILLPSFVLDIFKVGSHELFAWASLELQSSWFLPPVQLGLQVWATSTSQSYAPLLMFPILGKSITHFPGTQRKNLGIFIDFSSIASMHCTTKFCLFYYLMLSNLSNTFIYLFILYLFNDF